MEEAAGKVKTLSIDNKKDLLKHKGLSIVELWEVRDAINKIKPVIKRDFVTEYSNDKQRYEDPSDLHRKAVKSAEAGDNRISQSGAVPGMSSL
jgi:hypothetical protein